MDRNRILRIYSRASCADNTFSMPEDVYSKLIYSNVLSSCDKYLTHEPPEKIPYIPDTQLPYHNVYLAFYTGMQAACIMPHMALAYRLSGEEKYLNSAEKWLDIVMNWDTDLFSFYMAARLMHALICIADWLRFELSDSRLHSITNLLSHMCTTREDEALAMCRSNEMGGHANLYVAGFGLCALFLRDTEPKAEFWLSEVLRKYKRCLLPHDWSEDGTYPPDGTWAYCYAAFYKFTFLDAYKTATGDDLLKEYQEQLSYPVNFLRYAYMGGEKLPKKDYYDDHENLAVKGYNLNALSPVYLRFALHSKDKYLQWIALRDPTAGSILEYPNKVKQGPRFIFSPGLAAWFWYDSMLQAEYDPPEKGSALFRCGEIAIMRTGWSKDDLTLSFQGRRGNIMYESPGFSLNRGNSNFFVGVPTQSSLPVNEENALAVGQEVERYGSIRSFKRSEEKDTLIIDGLYTRQSIVMDKDKNRVHITAKGRNPTKRQVSLNEGYVSLDGGYLQYPRLMDDSAGILKMRFRIKRNPIKRFDRPSILFSTGQHLRYSFGHCMFLGFIEDGCLGVKFKDAEGKALFAQLPHSCPVILKDQWYDVTVRWSNLNVPGLNPNVSITLNDITTSVELHMPYKKPFVCRSNTSIWVGAGVQMPNSFTAVDIAHLNLYDRNGGPTLSVDYSKSIDAEQAKEQSLSPLSYRLHLYKNEERYAYIKSGEVIVRSGKKTLRLYSDTCSFIVDDLPYVRAGFAADSFEDKRVSYQHINVLPDKSTTRNIDFYME